MLVSLFVHLSQKCKCEIPQYKRYEKPNKIFDEPVCSANIPDIPYPQVSKLRVMI